MRYRAPRHETQSSIVLTACGIGRFFTVTNVSTSGAGIVGEKELWVGQNVTLNYEGGKVHAVVKWTDASKAGTAFERELNYDIVNTIIAASEIIDEQPARPTIH